MSVTVRLVDPDADITLLHGWVTEPRAAFWGMGDLAEEDVAAIYRYIQEQEHLAAYILELDGRPVGLFQTYDPAVDEIGEWYDRRPGDVGVHLLLAADSARAGRTHQVIAAGLDFVSHLPGCQRLVLEPDTRNAPSVALMERLGAERGPLVDLKTSISEKRAQFFFISREQARSIATGTTLPG